MRSVFLNGECVRIDVKCGLFPLWKCPVQVWAKKNNIDCIKKQNWFFSCFIEMQTKDKSSEATAEKINQIQKICDNCKYGEIQHTK